MKLKFKRTIALLGVSLALVSTPACFYLPNDSACTTDSDCDDGLYCNGIETCPNGLCQDGEPPCTTTDQNDLTCDEDNDTCVAPCLDDTDCDDGLFCNGIETCTNGLCQNGEPPCTSEDQNNLTCEEDNDTCVAPCLDDADCDDGLYCNGIEACTNGLCQVGQPPCTSEDQGEITCDETIDACVTPCSQDADCDDGLYCNGIETCESNTCTAGAPPCQNNCDEETHECYKACTTEDDCFDDDLCTCDDCNNGRCSTWTHSCDEDAEDPESRTECNPATGHCEYSDGSDPCLSTSSYIEQYDFDTRAASRLEYFIPCENEEAWCFLVAGTCEDGTLFLYSSDGMHLLVEYFDPETGAGIAHTSISDVANVNCYGYSYYPYALQCGDGTITEVLAGTPYIVGDTVRPPRHSPRSCP